jgi:DNA-binding MarR family transcriptional regulator
MDRTTLRQFGYHRDVSGNRGASKAAIAAEAWGAFLDVGMGQRNRFFRILQEFGLTPGDLRALMVLEPDAPRSMRSLAQVWECDPSNVTWMVDRLEERNLVQRRPVPNDRRVKAIILTPSGVETKARLIRRLHEPPAEFLALDRGTLEQLCDALAKLPASLRPAGFHAGPRPIARADRQPPSSRDTAEPAPRRG